MNPHGPTVVVALLGLLVAAAVLAGHVLHVVVDPARATPWVLLAVGLVLVGSGAVGLHRRR